MAHQPMRRSTTRIKKAGYQGQLFAFNPKMGAQRRISATRYADLQQTLGGGTLACLPFSSLDQGKNPSGYLY
jgi:hypothetical protein